MKVVTVPMICYSLAQSKQDEFDKIWMAIRADRLENQAASAFTILFRRLLWRAALYLLTIPLVIMESITGTAAL